MNNSDKLLNLLLKDSGKTPADLREYPKEAIPTFFSNSLSGMNRLPEDLEIVKFAASESFICFCLAVMPNFIPTKFHCLLADKLQGVYESILYRKESRLMVEVPPRHGKTQLVSILFPAWVLGKTDWPVICASYGSTLAERNSYECRAVLDSHIYKYIFPKTKLNPDSTSKEFWRVTSGGSYRAAGVGTGLTGLGGKILIIDDPFADRQSADSEQIRESTWRWYLSTLYTRREGKAGLVVLNTRWHEDDLTGRLLDQQKESEESGVKVGGYDKWERISFPAIADEDEFVDGKLFRRKGDVLWPEKFSVDDLERIKNNYKQTPGGMYEWSALYQQRPILSENAEFRREWFRYYEDNDLTSLNLYYITLCDLAISQKSSADNTVVRTIAVNRDKFQWFLCEETSGHLDPLQTIDAIFHHRNKYRSKVYIEEVGYQAALQHFVVEEQRKRGEFFTVEGIKQKTTTKKEERIRGLIPLYKAGVVFHKKGQDELLESQLLSFPKSRRDDNMDCLSFALGVAKHTPIETPITPTPNLKLPWWKKKKSSDDFDPREAFSKV